MQQMSGAFASSSNSPSSVAPSEKYEVFLSFRGEDTRKNFTAHLYDALCRKKVETFIDNNELEKGDEISPTLTKAIEESNVSIVIFSENYASSKWCLNELIKILECKKDYGQIVIPVFYNIDPTHVRKQTGSYQQAFAIHEQDFMLNKDKLHKWKAALTEAANLVGYDSQNYRTEADLTKDIIKDVLQKQNRRCPREVKGLVGIEKNLEQIESLLNIGSNDVKILGVWGMGGMGKTTLATAFYAKHKSQFEGDCFLPNVREESDKSGVNALQNRLFSELLEEENLRLGAPKIETPFLRRLERKKVLVVLDDVATSKQIEDLMINNNSMGLGSRVIVTTRDKQVFSQLDECEIYEVKELDGHDSRELFCLSAFKQKHPKIGYEDLSVSAIAYCQGNPLALKVLGANLGPKSEESWKRELDKLQKIPNVEIHSVLKLSYDDLDRDEQDIFRDMACFFKGWHRDQVISILDACDFPFSYARTKSDLIKDIIKVVLTNLNLRFPFELKGVVGIEKNLEQIESLLNIGSNDVKILGIWGMGGIGKTTLAYALVAKHHFQFEGWCFLPNVREQSNKFGGVDALRNKLFSDLLEEENVYLAGVSNMRRRLKHKKVLVVLDEVATTDQIEDLITINNDHLGLGSRVIVTSRDKYVFHRLGVCEIYEVKELNEHDSLRLFCLSAFKEKHPKIGYEDLSTNAIAYCQGNPLALKILGAKLHGRSKKLWESQLIKMQHIPDSEMLSVLKLSFDDLDRFQKDIFLDTACFFKGWHRDRVTSVLEACGFQAASGMEVLLDKALIQLNETYLTTDMHDLMREMGREIINQESRDPGTRSRLWKPQEVYDVLKNNKGTEVVEGITFDTAKVGRLDLSPDSFKRMTKLRYLHIHSSESSSFSNVYIPDGLGWLSDELRYLHWQAFSFESLPPNFCAEMLVVLSMPHSKLKKLWDGVQDLVHLKEICLDFSKYLIEVPDLSRAPNLERVSLRYCESLGQLHPSFLTLRKLTHLDLGGSKKMLKKLTQ